MTFSRESLCLVGVVITIALAAEVKLAEYSKRIHIEHQVVGILQGKLPACPSAASGKFVPIVDGLNARRQE